MADDIDQSQETYERSLNTALAERLNQPSAGASQTHCFNCEEEIPQARREALPGCTRCRPCQESFELLSHWRS